jgi:radical SAM superfamily enzyme YgiQ (UPF0313 family)
MANLIIINPPGAFKIGSPLISQLYLASSLIAGGHYVKVFDLGAKYYKFNFNSLVQDLIKIRPDLIGFTLYTSSVRSTYDLLSKLKAIKGLSGCIFAAGGPHATSVPEEPIEHGFDVVILREGEYTIIDLCKHITGILELSEIKGICYKTSLGEIKQTENRPFINDLNEIPLSVQALDLFNPGWYYTNNTFKAAPVNILSSRGCPGKCIYCANLVTGRRFRNRSPDNIIEEMNIYIQKYKATFFSFLDDSFTTNTERLQILCERFIKLHKNKGVKLKWSCSSRVDGLSKDILNLMRTAGCVSVNFGIESGSTETIERIGKGIKLDEVVEYLGWCKEIGLRSQVNFMFGFPWECVDHLNETLDYMQNIAPLTDAFSARGVLIPYPGTEIYERYKKEFDFDNWWLSKEIKYPTIPDIPEKRGSWSPDPDLVKKIYLEDPTLDLDFFKYSAEVKDMIKKCLEFKGRITLRKLRFY